MKKVLILATIAAMALGCAKEQAEKVNGGKTQEKQYFTAGIKAVETARSATPSAEGVFAEGDWLADGSRLALGANGLTLTWVADDALWMVRQKDVEGTITTEAQGAYNLVSGEDTNNAIFEGAALTEEWDYYAYYGRVGNLGLRDFYNNQTQAAPNSSAHVGPCTFMATAPFAYDATDLNFNILGSLLEFNFINTTPDENDVCVSSVEFVAPGSNQLYSKLAGPAGGTGTEYLRSNILTVTDNSTTALDATNPAAFWIVAHFVYANIDATTAFTVKVTTLKGTPPAEGNPDERVKETRLFKVKKDVTGFQAGKRYYVTLDWKNGGLMVPVKVAWRCNNSNQTAVTTTEMPSVVSISGLDQAAVLQNPTLSPNYPALTAGSSGNNDKMGAWLGKPTTGTWPDYSDAQLPTVTDTYFTIKVKADEGKTLQIESVGMNTICPAAGPKTFGICYVLGNDTDFIFNYKYTIGNATTGGRATATLETPIIVPGGETITMKFVLANAGGTKNGNFMLVNDVLLEATNANRYQCFLINGTSIPE